MLRTARRAHRSRTDNIAAGPITEAVFCLGREPRWRRRCRGHRGFYQSGHAFVTALQAVRMIVLLLVGPYVARWSGTSSAVYRFLSI
jgi:hypothetical protein